MLSPFPVVNPMNEVLANSNIPPNDPRFLGSIFTAIVKERKLAQARDGDNLKRVCAEEYDQLSNRLDSTRIQDSCSVRNILRTRRLANLLINDKGELITSLLPRVIALLTEHLYSLGPQRQYDNARQEHILKVLTDLRDNPELVRLLRQINKPYLHPLADQVIRDTLQLPPSTPITDAHAKRAALSAWMCYLRQNIGSCFATAPAIIVHDEQPELFLTDLYELLGTGRLKRTFGGIEYSAPLSSSWGLGDLHKTVVLSQWVTQEYSEVWYAPGLIVGLEASGLLDKEMPSQDKVEKTKEFVLRVFPEWNESRPVVLTSSEDILRRILMQHLGINENDLQAYDARPKGMIHSGLMMQTSSGLGGKGEACSTFYLKLDLASNAFKALSENALLKTWEFTIASFAETKSEFTRWNLYYSLGFQPDAPGGIGQQLFEIVKRKVDECNHKVADLQFEYEQLYPHIKQLEVRIRHASSDAEAQWIRMEYQSRADEFYTLEELRNKMHAKAQTFANLYDLLIDSYDNLFPQYFQEVYDPDLHEVQVGPFDDTPAGFRLLYKHGRSNTAQWTKIKNPQEFIDALAHFFVATEAEISALPQLDGLQSEIADITTVIVTHVRSQEFLESSFYRMAVAHKMNPVKDPLEHLDQIPMKPWAYVSGGTMASLVSCYYRQEHKPTEVARWVENPMELLVFLVDSLKHIPYKTMEPFSKDPKKSLLIHSPTHAFLLKPGSTPFKEAWQTEAYTYTWIRDYLVRPMEQFVSSLTLNEEMMAFLIGCFVEMVPINFQHYFKKVFSFFSGSMSLQEFRFYILDHIASERGLQHARRGILTPDDIDSVLYNCLPLFPQSQLLEKLTAIWNGMPQFNEEMRQKLVQLSEECSYKLIGSRILSAQNLQNIAQAIVCSFLGKTSLPSDYPNAIIQAAQRLGFMMPNPIFFADTNWVKERFAFLVNPGTSSLELWRIDPSGRVGGPMSSWQEWLNGTRKDPMWGIYNNPQEYSISFSGFRNGKIPLR